MSQVVRCQTWSETLHWTGNGSWKHFTIHPEGHFSSNALNVKDKKKCEDLHISGIKQLLFKCREASQTLNSLKHGTASESLTVHTHLHDKKTQF